MTNLLKVTQQQGRKDTLSSVLCRNWVNKIALLAEIVRPQLGREPSGLTDQCQGKISRDSKGVAIYGAAYTLISTNDDRGMRMHKGRGKRRCRSSEGTAPVGNTSKDKPREKIDCVVITCIAAASVVVR